VTFDSLLNATAIPMFRIRGPEDDYGNSVDTWLDGPAIKCSLQVAKSMGYRRAERPNPRGEYPLLVDYEFYFALGTTLRERDRFRVDGKVIEIDLLLGDASGRNHHLEGQGHEVRDG
jgi:hypothetical protein